MKINTPEDHEIRAGRVSGNKLRSIEGRQSFDPLKLGTVHWRFKVIPYVCMR